MTTFRKHRRASIQFSSDFTNALASGDNVASVLGIVVAVPHPTVAKDWVDRTSEFGGVTASASVASPSVQYTLAAATADGEQEPRDDYQIQVRVQTGSGEVLVDEISLEVTAKGDPGAVS